MFVTQYFFYEDLLLQVLQSVRVLLHLLISAKLRTGPYQSVWGIHVVARANNRILRTTLLLSSLRITEKSRKKVHVRNKVEKK